MGRTSSQSASTPARLGRSPVPGRAPVPAVALVAAFGLAGALAGCAADSGHDVDAAGVSASVPAGPGGAVEAGRPLEGDFWVSAITPAESSGAIAYALTVRASAGALDVIAGCLPIRLGTFVEAGDVGGSWEFTPGEEVAGACPPSVRERASSLVDALAQANRWEWQDEATTLGEAVISGRDEQVRLVAVDPDAAPSATPPSAPGQVADIPGTWRVKRVQVPPGAGTQGPFAWPLTIGQDRVTLPRGCNTGGGSDYVADASGHWAYAIPLSRTEIGCLGEAAESEAVDLALGTATVWTMPDPDTLILTGPGVLIEFTRQGEG
jgi:hypothetical protein